MRARTVAPTILFVVLLTFCLWRTHAEVLENPDFETGGLTGWDASATQLTIESSTNTTFNRNYAARIHGTYASDSWITNTLSQTISVTAGDNLETVGFLYWQSYSEEVAEADAYVEVSLSGGNINTAQVWTAPHDGWIFFDFKDGLFGLADGGFESGSLDSWTIGTDDLTASISSAVTYEGDYALKFEGSWAGGWSFNQAMQVMTLHSGDIVRATAKINVKKLEASDGYSIAGIKLENEITGWGKEHGIYATTNDTGWVDLEISGTVTNDGIYVLRCMVAGDNQTGLTEAEVYFDNVTLSKKPVRLDNGGFEEGTLDYWIVGDDHLDIGVTNTFVDEGTNSAHFVGTWAGWSMNQLIQPIQARSGDVIEATGRIYIDDFEVAGGWGAAGIKLESADGLTWYEHVYSPSTTEDMWLDLHFVAAITNTSKYDFRCMVLGDAGMGAIADIYFDDLKLWKHGEATGDVVDVTLAVKYCGYSGGAAYDSSADVYFDSIMLDGSTANLEPPLGIYTQLLVDASAIAAAPAEDDIPDIVYPPLNTYGYPGGVTSVVMHPAHVEAAVAGWRFRYLTNDVTLTFTNTIITYELGGEGPGFMEMDQYIYCARFWGTARGEPVEIDTNAPYFTLGTKDNSSAEFGNGPFEATHTYVVGTSLTNFPRRMVTAYDGTWPSTLHIVFQENLIDYDRTYDKYFVLSTIPTNGPASNVKATKIFLDVSEPGNTNVAFRTQEIHMGWGTEEECYGMVDYPNCTYQDHNEVFLRAGWLYGLLDQDGWFMQQVPRGSATIEPLDLFPLKNGNWSKKMYEEYLFSWPNAASGVRSIFEDDYVDHVPGPGSYHVGFKIGHQYGTNEFGEPQFPHVIEIRGNGYFRMTDYDGVMGGSFRPLSSDIFGLYQGKEDAPIMPAAYTRLIPRTTPTNQPDDSYGQVILPVHSKTNQWFVGAVMVDTHFAPDEVENEGAYFELESDVYANRALVQEEHGKVNAFAQVDMYWRGGNDINDYAEGHDFDAVVVKKSDGEWITHHPINPPTNIYHRSLCSFRSNDVVYLMQQDRGPNTYGFSTEAPYRKVSTFEITMLNDGGRDLSLDVFEQNTVSEINDNVVITCPLNEDLAKGDRVHHRYRYRSIYSPGVTLLSPDEPSGGEDWSNNTYTIEFYATDGEDIPLQANLYYGNGLDSDWTLVNGGELLLVPTDSHKVTYYWDVSAVPPGAYYIKAEAERRDGGKVGFDVSDTRIQVGDTIGFVNNGATNVTVVTNAFGYLGTNMSFETGDVIGWASGGDHLDIYATDIRSWHGDYSACMTGTGWSGWSWNNLMQEVPCQSGEVLHVTGRIYIDELTRFGTNWLRCGIKMESTNDVGRTSAGEEFSDVSPTGVWMQVDFERVAPVDGTDRLLLWVAGHDCSAVAVYFDDLHVASTNQGTVVTNRVRTGYWEGDTPVDISPQTELSFWVGGSYGVDGLRVWAADDNGVTNAVDVTNYVERVVSFPQRVDVPWTDFGSVDMTALSAVGFHAGTSNDLAVSKMRSITPPLKASVRFIAPPLVDLEGMPHFNPGQDAIQEITIENVSGAPIANVNVQLLQEYGETVMWLDQSPHVAARWSEKTRRGDRLGGGCERVWTGQTIPAGGSITLTNTYTLPAGKFVDHTKLAIPAGEDFYVFRNYEAHGQVHVVVRETDGDNVYDNDQVGVYSMDDDFDIDNDGLPDSWETLYGGDYVSMKPHEDPDGDSYDNLAEYQAGSDPTDPNSYPGHLTVYTLHLAYTNGVDLFPQAVAEQSNFTGAASAWMIARYLNGTNFNDTQQEIYDGNLHGPAHNNEITPQSIAGWMYTNAPPQYYFSARSRTNLDEAMKETVYWMDYLPPGGQKTPVYILCDTNWSYQVVRGFETDRAPYDGGFGVTTASTYTIYGLWLNDPRHDGLGYDVYATAEEMASVYMPSEADGTRWLVAEPPQDPDELNEALAEIDASTMIVDTPKYDPDMATFLQALYGDQGDGGDQEGATDLYGALPQALLDDPGFMNLFSQAGETNYHTVNPQDPADTYVLAAGGLRGPGSTVYVMKMDPTNGTMDRATWDADPSLYPPVSLEAAEWVARQQLGLTNSGGGTQQSSGNLLTNESFEVNTGAGGEAGGWNHNGLAYTETWAARSGGWGVTFITWDPNHSQGHVYQDYTSAEAGREYTFSVWMTKDSGFTAAAVDLKMEYYQADMTPIAGSSQNKAADLTTSFQKLSLTGIAPPGTAIIRCKLYVIGVGGAGALKCDDAELIEGELSVLQNGRFESGSSSGGGSDYWTMGPSAAAETWAQRDGIWGMSIGSWRGTNGSFYQEYSSVSLGSEYTFSIWMNKDSGFTASTLELKLEWLASDLSPISTRSRDVASLVTDAWQKFDVVGTPPAGAQHVRCTVEVTGMGGTGALKCDDAMLVEGVMSEPPLIEAYLVYDPQIDASPFLPRWRLVFDDQGQAVTNDVSQEHDVDGDSDNDGMSDGDELYAGTDPLNPDSIFTLDVDTTASHAGGGPSTEDHSVALTWQSTAGKYYSIHRATSLSSGFLVLESQIPAEPPENTYIDILPDDTTYYRVEVE